MTQRDAARRDDLWTADFPDPIVSHLFGYRHGVWIDHILVAPETLDPHNPVHLVVDSGRIAERNKVSKDASSR